MLQPLAIAVIGGILISMVLSLIITPAVQYYLTREKEAVVRASAPGAPVAVRSGD
jgi:Cu/Ag efflux pump CusA